MSTIITNATELFSVRKSKTELFSFVKENPNQFDDIMILAVSSDPLAWRAAWLIGHCMKKNDERVEVYIEKILNIIKNKEDGHQRQLLILLNKMDLNEKQEGLAFDVCLTIWEAVDKIPSVRITSFKLLHKIALNYPELKDELELWTTNYYTQTLSSGIKNTLYNIRSK